MTSYSNKCINVVLSDGIGNQFFQLAFALHLQSKGINTVVSTFKLSDNNITTHLSLPIQVNKSSTRRLLFLGSLFLRFKAKINFYFPGKKLTYKSTDPFASKYCIDKKYIEGYFQNKLFVENQITSLKTDLVMKKTTVFFDDYVKSIDESNSCAVHFRAGDYISVGFDILNIEYYEKSINRLHKAGVKRFVIFTSDQVHAKTFLNQLSFGNELIFDFFSHPHKIDIEELYIMSKFKYIIIANSTFSLWAAYLSNNAYVIGPKSWISKNIDPVNIIYFKNWHVV
jgi:hypothetical protein